MAACFYTLESGFLGLETQKMEFLKDRCLLV